MRRREKKGRRKDNTMAEPYYRSTPAIPSIRCNSGSG